MKRKMLPLAVLLLAFAALPTLAQPSLPVWTAVASTGAIDESSLSFFAFGGAGLGYSSGSGSVAPIVARYNVTDLAGTSNPAWATLEMGSSSSSAGSVSAVLYRVVPCSGERFPICQVNNSTGSCPTCSFSTTPLDFVNYLYYVEVTITRTSSTAFPQLNTLRIW